MMSKHTSSPALTWPMTSAAVNFKNGMIVTAEDLEAAMHYPVALMQSVNRAVYGCGVICGFEIRPDPGLCGKTGTETICINGTDRQMELHRSFRVEVGRGTAMDCSGLPIELCKPLIVDLSPSSCGCDPKAGGCVCIMIRRIAAPEAPRGDCCGTPSGPLECSRLRDHVEIRGFPADQLPDHYCGRRIGIDAKDCGCIPPDDDDRDCGSDRHATEPDHNRRGNPCHCLKDCDDCSCCGDGWVLLACLQVTSHGIVKWHDDNDDSWHDGNHVRGRKYVKTIECLCPPEPCEREKRRPNPRYPTTYGSNSTAADDSGRKLLSVMAELDEDIEDRLDEIIDEPTHRKFFRAIPIRNLAQLEHMIETQADLLKEVNTVFNRTNEHKLEAYLAATKEMLAKHGATRAE